MQSIVHILTKGPLYWNHSHCPKQSFETLLSQCLTLITLDNSESTILLGWQSSGHVLPSTPPPQWTTVPSGGMNQHVDFSLTCVWTQGLNWGILPDISFFFFRKACLQCWTLLHLVTLWPPRRALLLIDLWSWWGLQIRPWWPVRYHLRLNPSGAPGSFSTCQWSYSRELWKTVLGPPTAQLIDPQMKMRRGQNFPRKWTYPQDKRKNRDFCWFSFVIVFLAWNIKDSFWGVQRWCQEIL